MLRPTVPWFALKLVEDAVDLIHYARRERLGIESRLLLFAEVCDAVAHGHTRGVLHREDDDPDLRSMVATALAGRARILLDQQRFPEAEAALREVLALRREAGQNDPLDRLQTVNGLVVVLGQQGRLDEAEALARELLDRIEAARGADDASVQELRRNLALVLERRGDSAAAEELLRDVFDWQTLALGESHARTLNTGLHLGVLLQKTGRLDQAAAMLEENLAHRSRTFGENHLSTLESMNALAVVRRDQGQIDQAIDLYEELLRRYEHQFPDGHPGGMAARVNLAYALMNARRLDEALHHAHAAVDALTARAGAEHPQLPAFLNILARVHRARGELELAEEVLARALEIAHGARGEVVPMTRQVERDLARVRIERAEALVAASRTDEARPLLEAGIAVLARLGVESEAVAAARALLATCAAADEDDAE